MTDEAVFLEPIEPPESGRLLRALREETTGGLLLIVVSLAAIVIANSPLKSAYASFTNFEFGPASLGLHMSINHWAADFLLAIFFFVVGNELKHEMTLGSLANPREALVPIVAAVSGMAAAAGIFLFFNSGDAAASAWAIPISTDVAFALAVLALAGKGLPLELRSFLLTVAVVNDLCAISVIAVFYDQGFKQGPFLLSLLTIGIFALLQYRLITTAWLGLPLALLAWYWMYQSGIHATVAGVLLGLAMNVKPMPGQTDSPADRAEHVFRPISAGICVPFFAFTSIGISLAAGNLGQMLTSNLTYGICLGLIIGQPLGVTVGAYLATKISKATLNPSLQWWDVLVVGTLAAIGFTVALLVSEVSFHGIPYYLENAKLAIAVTNFIAILISVIAVRIRNKKYQASIS